MYIQFSIDSGIFIFYHTVPLRFNDPCLDLNSENGYFGQIITGNKVTLAGGSEDGWGWGWFIGGGGVKMRLNQITQEISVNGVGVGG